MPISEILRPRGWRRLVTAHFVIDETTAMAVGQADRAAERYAFWSTGLILLRSGRLGSLVGALLGDGDRPGDVRPGRGRTGGLPGAALAGR